MTWQEEGGIRVHSEDDKVHLGIVVDKRGTAWAEMDREEVMDLIRRLGKAAGLVTVIGEELRVGVKDSVHMEQVVGQADYERFARAFWGLAWEDLTTQEQECVRRVCDRAGENQDDITMADYYIEANEYVKEKRGY